jgi:isopentenyl diphosphate isomerase/L-lactate dehydrogenase-like FMN-dependent dehydrogenase
MPGIRDLLDILHAIAIGTVFTAGGALIWWALDKTNWSQR